MTKEAAKKSKWLKEDTLSSALATTKKGKNDVAPLSMAAKADKHDLYQQAVQLPQKEVLTLHAFYKAVHANTVPAPLVLREDFCGTALLCKEWVKRSPLRSAIGVDLDQSVLHYAQRHIRETDPSTMDQITLFHGDVLSIEKVPSADIIAALNYGQSFAILYITCYVYLDCVVGCFYFHTRKELVDYLVKSRESLKKHGVMICDLFGGYDTYLKTESITKRRLNADTFVPLLLI